MRRSMAPALLLATRAPFPRIDGSPVFPRLSCPGRA